MADHFVPFVNTRLFACAIICCPRARTVRVGFFFLPRSGLSLILKAVVKPCLPYQLPLNFFPRETVNIVGSV